MTAAALWTSVVSAYAASDLIQLTNPGDTTATSIATSFGQNAAQEVIDLWPIKAQVAYDASDATHVAIGRRWCIAVLWDRGGTASQAAQIKWDDVKPLLEDLKNTDARSRQNPDGGGPDMRGGQSYLSYSHPKNIPGGIMPRRRRDDGSGDDF